MRLHPDWLDWPQTQALVAAFAREKAELRFVGGAVRDALLNGAPQEVDAAAALLPEQMMALLKRAGIQAIPTGIAHGTVTAVINDKHFEITTLRKDTACDGRHAEVTFTDNWQEDAVRRDFTMNALYLSPSGQLFDYFGGAEDARAGCVRFIGDPGQRITEDYLRILRFFRFSAWYGKGAPDKEALRACKALAAQMERLSGERVQAELLKLLAAPHPSPVLQLMQEYEICSHVVGFDLTDCGLFARFEALEGLTGFMLPPYLKLCGFLFAAAPPLSKEEALAILAQRLKLPVRMTKTLQSIIRHHDALHPAMTEWEQKRLLRRLGAQDFRYTILIRWAYSSDAVNAAHPYMRLLSLPDQWQPPVFPITGNDLIALGVQPGKKLGERLRQLEQDWEMSGYRLSKEQLLVQR